MFKAYLVAAFLCAAFVVAFILPTWQGVSAQTKEDLQAQIDDTNSKISQLEAEIAQTQKDLDATTKQKTSLQNTVKQLDLSRKKVTTNITLTQTKISQKDAQIAMLGNGIATTTTKIDLERAGIMSSLRNLDQQGSPANMLISIFAGDNLSSFFNNASGIVTLRNSLQQQVADLANLKTTLVTTKSSSEQKRKELAVLKADLSAQQAQLDANRKEEAALLAATQNKESNYQALLAQKQARKSQFESDLNNFEAQLNLIVDPSSIPQEGSVLVWPVKPVRITQYFGNTDFATKNPQIYSGHGHNAIDLGVPQGTNVMAALNGVVKGTGDTDQTCPNASYGKWVLIEHPNGLSTLYAHLSYIRVTKGQSVATGETIAYSGSTGYATGPHLHFSVYATQGVEITTFASKSCVGKKYTMPVADLKAYLNPLTYLPPVPK